MQKALQALDGLIRTLADVFGPTGTAIILLALAVGAIGWQWWSHRKKQRELDRIFEGSQALIRELEAQLRAYRAEELSERRGISYEQALHLINETYPSHEQLATPSRSRFRGLLFRVLKR